jgi:hypothetical protein
MDSFVTWESLLTFGGCVTGTILLTEFVKRIFGEKVPAQLVSFLIAAVILFVGHLAAGTFAWREALLYIINAAAVSLSANGGFDAIKKALGGDDDEPPDHVIIDESYNR